MITQVCNTIKKSHYDTNKYRYIQLSNKIRCLLVQDEETQKAAATLNVNVGSLSDPPGINGLAHFCEHMLFLGTEKYPDENHYAKFLTSHNGQKNAATSEDSTYYFFSIKNEQFEEALDIFSQFFKEPLFTESATEREMNAVDSEFQKNVSNDARRLFQIEKSHISKQGGVLNRFSTGNLETLNLPNIREQLLQFYDTHYSSNLMTLCLVGNHELDKLQQMAVDNFHSIPNKNFNAPDLRNEETFSLDNGLGHIFRLVPEKDLKQMSICWPMMPETLSKSQTKPVNYLSHVIGHEGPNSLLSTLIKEGLAAALSSGEANRLNFQKSGLKISITLTQKGVQNWEQVLKIVFAFIN